MGKRRRNGPGTALLSVELIDDAEENRFLKIIDPRLLLDLRFDALVSFVLFSPMLCTGFGTRLNFNRIEGSEPSFVPNGYAKSVN